LRIEIDQQRPLPALLCQHGEMDGKRRLSDAALATE
jgi:hypothetical protein